MPEANYEGGQGRQFEPELPPVTSLMGEEGATAGLHIAQISAGLRELGDPGTHPAIGRHFDRTLTLRVSPGTLAILSGQQPPNSQ